MKKLLLSSLVTVASCCSYPLYVFSSAPTDSYNHMLYYTAPASIWEETLPLGNGRLGMMPDGGVRREHIVLNEISLWNGSEADYGNPDAAKSLPAIRRLLFEGKNREAQELMYSSFVPKKGEADKRYGTYQILANLDLEFDYPLLNAKAEGEAAVTAQSDARPVDYRRGLNLRDALAYTAFTLNDVAYRREYFISRDKDVMLIHLTAGRKEALSFSARLSRPERAAVTIEGNTLLMNGMLDSGLPGKDGMKFRVAMRLVSKGGEQAIDPERGIALKNGQEAWLVISATTSYEAAGTDFPGERYASVCDRLLDGVAPSGSSFAKLNAKLQRTMKKKRLIVRFTTVFRLPCPPRKMMRFPPTSVSSVLSRKNLPDWPLYIITTAAICSSAVPVPAACPPTCKGFGQTRCRLHGTATIIPTSISR